MTTPDLFGQRLLFREQLYGLYHRELGRATTDIAENIVWLETALNADFANPLYALARIQTDQEWQKYRSLFTMHINLALVDLYLQWAALYTKFDAFFYNYPWRRQNVESLDTALSLLELALFYWEAAQTHSAVAAGFRWLFLEEIQFWEDQSFRIESGELDYRRIIDTHRQRIGSVREQFTAMDPATY